jgi:hypothetical protein
MFMDMHAHTLKAPIGPLSDIDFEHHGVCVQPSSNISVRSMVSAYSIQQNGLIHLGLYTKVHGLLKEKFRITLGSDLILLELKAIGLILVPRTRAWHPPLMHIMRTCCERVLHSNSYSNSIDNMPH